MAGPLPSIPNFRDVGETVNHFTGRSLLATGKLFRSARPDEATREDRRRLLEEYGIRHILDLRTKTEHIEQAQKRDAKVRSSALAMQSNDEVAEPLKIPGITYHEVNFNGSAFSWSLVNRLSWWDFGKLITWMGLGYRLDAISILGTNVMQPMGLVGLATDSIDVCTKEVLQVFQLLAEPSNYPLLIHCTQGKDRTGLTVSLCLSLLGVPLEAIDHDYMLSQKGLVAERDERVREIKSIGLGEEFADCDPNLTARVAQHIEQKHGGVQRYLLQAGVTADMQDSVRRNLRASET